jgi:hypothetical protein
MYLIPSDFKKTIQTDNLNQIIGSDTSILSAAELTAMEEVSSYLVQKYNLSRELQNTLQWDKTVAYHDTNRVYFNPPAFDPATVYTINQYVTYNGNTYFSIAGSAAHAFNAAEWTLIGVQYQIYSAALPANTRSFDVNAYYRVGDKVIWNGKTYTCLIASTPQGFPPNNQVPFYENMPLPNVFPDDTQFGLQYWGAGVVYAIPANTDIRNTAYWTAGDNRSQQLITYMVDIAVYHIHKRIAPRNIPDIRCKAYDDAKSWLKMCAKGDVTANLPVLQPKQGGRIRYGGPTKTINSY